MKSLSSPSTVPTYPFFLQGPFHFFKLLLTITFSHNWRQTAHADRHQRSEMSHHFFYLIQPHDRPPHFTVIISFFHILLVETLAVPGFPVRFSILLCLLITGWNWALMFMKAGLSVNNRHAKATKRCIYQRLCASQSLCQNPHTCASSLAPATLDQENLFSFNSSAPMPCGEAVPAFLIYLAKEKLI